jgi:hypothetical protein
VGKKKVRDGDEARSLYVREGCCIRLEQTSAASEQQITLKSPFTAALGCNVKHSPSSRKSLSLAALLQMLS